MPRSLKMREKQKNGLVETVKRFFDDSVKNIERSKWMNKSRNCSSRVEHKKRIILNALQCIHFVFILLCFNPSFSCYMNIKIIFWKAGIFMPYICHIVTKNEKRFNWVVIWFREKFRCLGKITKICSLKKPLLYCLGFIYAGCYKIVQMFFQLFLSYFQCAKLLLLL